MITTVVTENNIKLSSSEPLNGATVVAGLFEGNSLEKIVYYKGNVTTKAFEEIDLGSVSISEDDLSGYQIRVFVWNDMKPVF